MNDLERKYGKYAVRDLSLKLIILYLLGYAIYYLNPGIEFKFDSAYQKLPDYGFNGIPVALLAINNPIGVIFSAVFMSMLQICGQKLTELTAYNEYITNVIIAVIVYLSAFMLVIKMWIGKLRSGKAVKK